MIQIYRSLERNRKVYNRLIGAQTYTERQRLHREAQVEALAPMNGWEASNLVPQSTEAQLTASVSEENWVVTSESTLATPPPDPLETAELFTRAVEAEERFFSQNLEREER